MTTFNPKEQFKTYHATLFDEMARFVEQPWFCIGLVYALAQFAATGATKEELDGARRFIQHLLNLSDKEVPLPQFPKRELTSYEQQLSPTEKK